MSVSKFNWQRTGAWSGGTVHSVARSSDTSYPFALAATDAGVFCSMDAGRTWARTRDLAYAAAHTVAIVPGDARSALAATTDGSLFRSDDAGASWRRQNSWSFGAINALALSPNFATDGTLFAATTDGIYRSLDGGRRWQSASFGLLDGEVLCLACAPDFATSEVVWAGSVAGGLFRSRNSGRAWREAGEGLADSAVQCIAYDGATLFVGTEGGGTYRSSNGVRWEAWGLEGVAVNCLAVHAKAVLAGTSGGLFRSDNEAQSWQRVMADDGVLALAVAPDGGFVAGGVTMGVLTSVDEGQTWQCPDGDAGLAAHVPPLAAQSPDGALFLFNVVGGVVCSNDSGSSWRDIYMDDGPIECVVAGGTARQPLVLAATASSVMRREADAFKPLSNQPELSGEDAITTIAVTPEGTLLLGTRQGGVAIATHGGAAWQMIAVPGAGAVNAVHLTPLGSLFVLRLAPAGDGANNAEVWLLPALGLPMVQPSADWRMVLALDALQTSLTCMTVLSDEIGARVTLAGQNVIAVARLADEHAHIATLPIGTSITSLIAAHTHLFVGTNAGMFASTDGGITWQLGAGDLDDAPVVALFSERMRVRAITLGGEVWSCDVPA